MSVRTATTLEAIEAIEKGEFLIVVDDAGRQNTGDLMIAAQHADASGLNRMMLQARGTLCLAMGADRLEQLGIPPMLTDRDARQGPTLHVSVDARHGTTSGDSAGARALTVAALIDPATKPSDLVRPGHMQTAGAVEGGVLRRAGHTEAAVDFAHMAGLAPAGVMATVLDSDGEAATMPQLAEMSRQSGIKVASIAGLIEHRRSAEKLVEIQAEASLPTRWGEFNIAIYTSLIDGSDYIALYMGDLGAAEAPLVRVHSGCVTGDILGSLKCDCGQQLAQALENIAGERCGVVVYIPSHEGRGIGLVNKIRAYHLQEQGYDTVEANEALGLPNDARGYGDGAQVLADLGITRMRLMTNNPAKYAALEGFGLDIVERVPLDMCPTDENRRYLDTKRRKMGHLMESQTDEV